MRLLIIGAHPDDADYAAGGTAAWYRRSGHDVLMVSMTNGDAGHHQSAGAPLAQRRLGEANAAAAVIGATYRILDNHDGFLEPTIANRLSVIRLLRSYRPDLVLTHRPNDYHPDHRYTSQLVQDAAYMVTVPAIAPDTPHLSANPVIAYLPDEFQKPYPFSPAVAVDVGPVIENVIDMLCSHVSQFFEWLPYNVGVLEQVPPTERERREWLGRQTKERLARQAERFRPLLIAQYGPQAGAAIQYAEAFEPCEYGAPLDAAATRRLFPFAFAKGEPRT
ncbi:MAG: PIG-L deacetylase family protein [Gemmataceae bacterium]